MAKTAKYVLQETVATIHKFANKCDVFLNLETTEDISLQITDKIDKLKKVTINDIRANNKHIDQTDIGLTISEVFFIFALNTTAKDAYRLIFPFAIDDKKTNSPNRINEAKLVENNSLISQTIRISALFALAYLATQIEYEIDRDAIQARADLAELIDFEIGILNDVELSKQLLDARDHAVSYLSSIINDLSNLVDVEIPISIPSLKVSYMIYGEASKAESLINMNELSHGLNSPTKLKATM